MKTIERADATDSLAKYAEQAADFPIIITDHGQPIAALLSVPNADLETISLSTNPQFLSLISRSRMRQETEGGISRDEMRRRLEVPPAEPKAGDQANVP
jgi:antitoxin (DNA-binding transcriptional repressor) of toxin-antitoxin stability system